MSLRDYVRSYFATPIVRPWALIGPILVLLVCLPMLRPLQHPADVSDDETLRLATITALSEHGSLDLRTVPDVSPAQLTMIDGRAYADQPPMLALLLSGPAWVMNRIGYPIAEDSALAVYVLTLLGVTVPVALAASLLYRMGRLFELPRIWRAGLATAIVFGSGLVSYGVVLNPHAPAAALVLCSAACLIHLNLATRPPRGFSKGLSWVFLAGVCSAFAAALDPPALMLTAMFTFVILAMRMPIARRLAAVVLFLIGAAGPVALHASWQRPITGEVIPGLRSAGGTMSRYALTPPPSGAGLSDELDADDVISNGPSRWIIVVGGYAQWLFDALFGAHGILSHFPVVLIGVLGVGAVMHRHWPSFVKTLAAASAISALVIIGLYASVKSDWLSAMFAARWFVVFLPMLLFWSGAWVRRTHSPMVWTVAGTMLAFSIAVSLIGVTQPYPRGGYSHYTPKQAMGKLMKGGTKELVIGNRDSASAR